MYIKKSIWGNIMSGTPNLDISVENNVHPM